MSVKFVQSSDNKYVQYRFLLPSFTSEQFATESNWENVDEVIKDLGDYTLCNIYDGEWELGDINRQGAEVPSTTVLRTVNCIVCFPQTQYRFIASTEYSNTYTSLGIAYFYDEDFEFISYTGITRIVKGVFNCSSPSGAKYFKVVLSGNYGAVYNNDVKIYQYGSVGANIVVLQEMLQEIKPSLKMPVFAEYEKGGIDTTTGSNIYATNRLRTKNYINCAFAKVSVECKNASLVDVGSIFFYDKNLSFVSYSAFQNGILTVPTNAKYFKIALSTTYGNTYNEDIVISLSDKLGEQVVNIEQFCSSVLLDNSHILSTDWEIGDINSNTGNNQDGSTTLRTKDYVKCPSTKFLKVEGPTDSAGALGSIYYYDKAKVFIRFDTLRKGVNGLNGDASFFRIVLRSKYGTTYNNDIFLTGYYLNKPVKYIVSKDGTGDYQSVTDAVNNCADGDIVFVKNGIYNNEVIRAWSKNISIIGENKYGVQIKGGGDYANPPLEMASGMLKNVSIHAYGDTPTQSGRYAYAIHADNEILANNNFVVENCILRSNKGTGVVGMGLRGGCHVLFKDCDFIADNYGAFFMNEAVTKIGQTGGDQHFEFNNCKFICNGEGKYYGSIGTVMAIFEGYKSDNGLVHASFINNVFVHKDVDTPKLAFMYAGASYCGDSVTEGNITLNAQDEKMINWFVTEQSFGNNIEGLDRRHTGRINKL
jgi:hypothetical protein